MIRPLGEVLQYQNEDVVVRFSQDYQVAIEDSYEIFHEMKRWLWFSAKRTIAVDSGNSEHVAVPLFNEARAVDLMWHTFLLYSRDYMDFCDRYLGFYLHHQPRAHSERKMWLERIASDPHAADQERKESLRKVYELIYDELGEDVLLKWCEEFPNRFKFKYLALDR